MGDFGKTAERLAKGLGNAVLDHFENESERLSRNSKVSEQMREDAARLNSSLKGFRSGNYSSNYDDEDY